MANHTIETENYHIIASGSVMTINNEKLIMNVTDTNKNNLKINIIFVDNKENGQDIKARPSEDGDSLNITIYNADKSGGITNPLQITADNSSNKGIFLNIYFQKVTNYFVVQYTFFQKK